MTFIISPEYTLMFINILLLSGFVAFYILYLRHDRTRQKRLMNSNITLTASVSSLTEAMNKVLQDNAINRAVAERQMEEYKIE